MQFAGSLDGVAYGRSSTPQQLRTDTDFPEPIDLRALLPEHSRFVRIILTMSRTDPAVQPRFAGFTVNYELATGASSSGQNTVSADPAAAVKLSVNNTTAGSVDAPAPPSSPNSLAATGVGDWIIVGMFALAIGGALLLLRMRNDRHL